VAKGNRKRYEQVKRYCKKRGVEVKESYNEQDMALLEKGLIVINLRHSDEVRLFILLHEVGHFLLYWEDDYELLYEMVISGGERRLENRVLVVNEEAAAWDAGYRLGKRLGIKLNRKRYHECKCRSIYEYMKWATNHKRRYR
jgi:hypothetical protein